MKTKLKAAALAILTLEAAGLSIAAVSRPDSEPAPIAEPAAYYLRDCGGFVAVYRADDTTPLNITGIETATLNDTDARLLLDGIPADSRNELLLLLEDLGS